MIIKLMSDEDAPDHDTRKRFRLIEGVSDVEFHRNSDGSAYLTFIEDGNEQGLSVEGNAYILNDAGKTIASFGAAPLESELQS